MKRGSKGKLLLKNLKITVMPTCQRKGLSRSTSQTLICAAECFWPSTVFMHAELVRKNETGPEKGLWLPRFFRNTVVSCTTRRGNSR
jgi:hypothetical protein